MDGIKISTDQQMDYQIRMVNLLEGLTLFASSV